MLHGLRRGAGPMAVGAVAGLVAAFAFGNTSSLDLTPAQGQPYKLYPQCGIGESRIGNRHFAAIHPLGDRAGDPPAGRGNQYQAGTMTPVSSTEAVFTDGIGHRVIFRLRPGTTFPHTCPLLADGGG